MAKKKEYKTSDIKSLLEQGKLTLGTNTALKALKQGALATIFLSANCKQQIKDDIEQHAKISKIEVVQLSQPNDEVGIICKKPFAISVLGLRKG